MVFQEHNHPGQMEETIGSMWYSHQVVKKAGQKLYSPCVTEAALGSEAAP